MHQAPPSRWGFCTFRGVNTVDYLKNNKGQSMVEFAIVLPILLIILLGIMEFGILFSNQLILESASREGTRFAVLGATDGEVVAYIADLTSNLDASRLTISISPSQVGRAKGNPLTVTLTYQYQFLYALFGDQLGTVIQLTADATMRIE